MGCNSQRFRWLIILAALLVFVGIYWHFVSSGGQGKIRELRAVGEPKRLISTIGNILHGKESLKSTPWREVFSSDDNYLDIGPAKIKWLTGGYLCFNTEAGPWEFALCSKRDLKEVSKKDLQNQFVGEKDLVKGYNVFGRLGYNEDSINVITREIILARLAKKPGMVYALKIRRRENDTVWVSVMEITK